MNDRTRLGDCQRGDSSLIRPHFTEGLLLQDDDLTAGVTYTRALSRLMFRTLFGCGVLCGLKVGNLRKECDELKIDVAGGVALSCLGDPIEVCKPQTIGLDPCKVQIPGVLWIALRGTEKCCAPRTAICSPDEESPASVCTRERDGFELCTFSSRPPCSCGCRALGVSTDDNTDTPGAADTSTPAVPASGETDETPPDDDTPCHCNKRTGPKACYGEFYAGECPGCCCDCEWIILAKATRDLQDEDKWTVDHSVRRFVRPVLMRDPLK